MLCGNHVAQLIQHRQQDEQLEEDCSKQVEESQIELWLLKHHSAFNAFKTIIKHNNICAMHRAIRQLAVRSMENSMKSRVAQVNSVAKQEITRLVLASLPPQ